MSNASTGRAGESITRTSSSSSSSSSSMLKIYEELCEECGWIPPTPADDNAMNEDMGVGDDFSISTSIQSLKSLKSLKSDSMSPDPHVSRCLEDIHERRRSTVRSMVRSVVLRYVNMGICGIFIGLYILFY